MTKRRNISTRERFLILQRDGFRCRYCGATPDHTGLHVDHVVPISEGGPDTLDNMVASCADCNLGKAAGHVIPGCSICNTSYTPVRSFAITPDEPEILVCTTCVKDAVHLLFDVTAPGSTFSRCPSCGKCELGARTVVVREPYGEWHICTTCWADIHAHAPEGMFT